MKRPSKRLLAHLSVLSVVVVLGTIAIAQAQRVLRKNASENTENTRTLASNASPEAIPDTEEVASDSPRSNPFSASRLMPVNHTVEEVSSPATRGPADTSHRDTRFHANQGRVPIATAESPTSSETAGTPTLAAPTVDSTEAPAYLDSVPRSSDPYGLRRTTEKARAPVHEDDAAAESRPGGAPVFTGNTLRNPAPVVVAPQEEGLAADETRVSESPAPVVHRSRETPAPVVNRSSEAAAPDATARSSGDSVPPATAQSGEQPGPTVETPGRFVPGVDAVGRTLSDEGTGKPGTAPLEGSQTPSLVLEKIAPSEIQVGKTAKFTVKVRNVGNATAEDVVIRDEVPQGTTLVDVRPAATQAARGVVVWQLGSIDAGEEKTVSMELMPTAEGEVGSVATVTFAAKASVRTICTRPELVLEHSAPRKVLIGEDVTLSIKLSNPGTGAATGVVLEEDVPEGLSHPSGRELEYEVGTLKPGETRELELTLKAAKAGIVDNVLRSRGDASLLAEDRVQVEIIAPELQVGMDGPRRRYLERQATYTVLIANPGTAPAKEVELVAYLPKGLKFVETNNAGHYDAEKHAVYWSLAELPAKRKGMVELTALPIEEGEQKLRVEGRAEMGLFDEHEQNIVVEGLAALLFEVADADDPIEVGNETTYEVRVVNQGSKTSTNIRLAALLPSELKPLSGDGPTRGAVDGQRVLFEPLPRLAPKADALYKIRVQGIGAGDQRIRVQLLSDEIRTPVTKEESTRVYADD